MSNRRRKWATKRDENGNYVGKNICPHCGGRLTFPLIYAPITEHPVCNECWHGHIRQLEVMARIFPSYQVDLNKALARSK